MNNTNTYRHCGIQARYVVGTVKMFAQAAIQGQPFVVIDRSNMNEALANITGLGDDTRADIVNSVLAGNTVTTHSMPINMGNWRGFGYVVFNPQTFSSVYMIDGGPRGGCTACGDGDDEQAYNSFVETSRFAGSICIDFIVTVLLTICALALVVPVAMAAILGLSIFVAALLLLIVAVQFAVDPSLTWKEKAILIAAAVVLTIIGLFLTGVLAAIIITVVSALLLFILYELFVHVINLVNVHIQRYARARKNKYQTNIAYS